MQMQEIQDNIRSRRNKIFLLMEEVFLFFDSSFVMKFFILNSDLFIYLFCSELNYFVFWVWFIFVYCSYFCGVNLIFLGKEIKGATANKEPESGR